MDREKPEGARKRHSLRNVLGVVGIAAALSIPGGYFAYQSVSSHVAVRRAFSMIDTLDSNYTCKSLADNLINPQDLTVNPADGKIYFVQKQTSDFSSLSGASEWVYELYNGKIRQTKFSGAGDPWGGIHITRIAINSQNQIYVYNGVYREDDINIFNLATQERIDSLDLALIDKPESKIVLKRIKDRGFDLSVYSGDRPPRSSYSTHESIYSHSYSPENEVTPVAENRPAKKIPYTSNTIGGSDNPIARIKKDFMIQGLDLDKEGNIYFSIGPNSRTWNKIGKIIMISKNKK